MKSISLMPDEAKGIRGVIVPNSILVFLVGSFIFLIGLTYYIYQQNQKVSTAQAALEAKATDNLGMIRDVEKLKNRKVAQVDSNLEETIGTINTIANSRTNWVKYVNKFNRLGDDYSVKLTGINLASTGGTAGGAASGSTAATGAAAGATGGGGNITLTGTGANQKIVSAFVQGLRDRLHLDDLDVTLTGVPTKGGRGLVFNISVNYPIPATQGVPAASASAAPAATQSPAAAATAPATGAAPTPATGGGG